MDNVTFVFVFLRQLPPEATLFLAMAFGYAFGKIRFGSVQFGGVCGTLIMALLFGQSGVVVDSDVKDIFFAMFIFALGFAGGPHFFANLNIKSMKLAVLSFIEVLAVLTLATIIIFFWGFDPGTTAGLVAGAATESALIGTASEALAHLLLSAEIMNKLQANIVTTYSVTYIFGLVGIVLFTSQVAPRLLRMDLQKEAEALWDKVNGSSKNEDKDSITPHTSARTYKVTVGAKNTVGTLQARMGDSLVIQRVVRRGKILQISPELALAPDDIILIMGALRPLLRAKSFIGEEVDASPYANMVVETENYTFVKKRGMPKTLGELADVKRKSGLSAEVYVEAVVRNGKSMPLLRDLALQTGDVLRMYGSQPGIARFGASIGVRVPASFKTNITLIGLGLVGGLLIGRFSLSLGGMVISLGSGGGALLSGLLCGNFQSRHPSLHGAPSAALEMMKDIGLASFVGCVGLASGPQAFEQIQQYGIQLPLIGLVITLVPAMISLVVGHKILRLELPILLGGISGQQCSTPALSAVQAVAGNTTPLIGYSITYAISNVLLPLLGPLIVGISTLKLTG